MPQYYLSKNSCKKCKTQNCDQCKSIQSNMTYALINLYNGPNESTQKSIRCSFGNFLREDQCQKCFEACQRCSDSQSCLQCKKGFYLNDNQTLCIGCSQHCLKCNAIKDSLQVCTSCQQGYTLYVSNSICLSCMDNCLLCTGYQDSCLKCQDGYYKAQLNQTNHGCRKCKSPCKDCEDQAQCLNCVTGYFLSPQDSCIQCQAGCSQCNQEGCFFCEPTYRLNYENLTCAKCKVDKCQKSQNSLNPCDTCQDGYKYFAPKQIQSANPICYRCDETIEGCRKCASPSWYTQCFSGLILVTSENPAKNSCNKALQSIPWGMLIAIGCLSLLAVILMGVILVLKRRARKSKNQEEANEKKSLIDDSSYSINSLEVISDKHMRRSLRSSFREQEK